MTKNAVRFGSHPVDIHVGGRLRDLRKSRSLTQEALAEAIDLTFQQVQKYERGSNRISASKLFEISRFLKIPVGYYFEGLESDEIGQSDVDLGSEQSVTAFLSSAEGAELAMTFPRVRNLKVRRRLVELVHALADDKTVENHE